MAHEQIPPRDWNQVWDEFVTQHMDQARDPNQNWLHRAFQLPIAAGGAEAYGLVRGLDPMVNFLLQHHIGQMDPTADKRAGIGQVGWTPPPGRMAPFGPPAPEKLGPPSPPSGWLDFMSRFLSSGQSQSQPPRR